LTNRGEEKPPAQELRKFSQTIKKIDLGKLHFPKPEAALLVPKDYYKHVKIIWPRLLDSFILAKEAHIELDFVREGANLANYKLVLIPSSYALRTSSWYDFKRYVEGGGHLYFSYGGSPTGGWSPNPIGPFFDEIFGVTLQDRISPLPSEEMTFIGNWLGVRGLKLKYPNTEGTGCLEVDSKPGRSVAKDQRNHAAIIVNKNLGHGTALLATHPLEYYLSLLPDAYLSNQTYRVYSALRKEAGLTAPFTCDSPFLETSWMEADNKDEAILIMINHERVKINSKILLHEKWDDIADLDGAASITAERQLNVKFAPSEVKLLSLKR
jgi:endo-1,4-beta-mannosidase